MGAINNVDPDFYSKSFSLSRVRRVSVREGFVVRKCRNLVAPASYLVPIRRKTRPQSNGMRPRP